jgi:hypothetical protein
MLSMKSVYQNKMSIEDTKETSKVQQYCYYLFFMRKITVLLHISAECINSRKFKIIKIGMI